MPRYLHAASDRLVMITAIGVAELILAAATVVTLMLGLALPAWRRVLRWVSWIAYLLACLGLGLLYA